MSEKQPPVEEQEQQKPEPSRRPAGYHSIFEKKINQGE